MAVTRENETRAAKARKSSWTPPSLLPSPDPQAGYSYRWVRIGSRGSLDNKNVSARFREGWEPVNAKDHPELKLVSDSHGKQFEDGVEIGGLLLCKIDTDRVKARNEYYNARASEQMQSVDNSYLRESDPRMPLLKPERRTRVTFGSAPDE
jgi:hypothetical protein